MGSAPARILGPTDGKAGFLGSMGVRFMVDGLDSGGGFSLVEHPLSARALAAPLHRHSREDEYSYVLEGRVGALLGDEVAVGGPGDLIFKPRGQWHTFWNAGDEPARLLEIISPAGFEQYFAELVELGGSTRAAPQDLAALGARYGLEVEPQSIPGLVRALRAGVSRRAALTGGSRGDAIRVAAVPSHRVGVRVLRRVHDRVRRTRRGSADGERRNRPRAAAACAPGRRARLGRRDGDARVRHLARGGSRCVPTLGWMDRGGDRPLARRGGGDQAAGSLLQERKADRAAPARVRTTCVPSYARVTR